MSSSGPRAQSSLHADVESLLPLLPKPVAQAVRESEAAGKQVLDIVVREGYPAELRFDDREKHRDNLEVGEPLDHEAVRLFAEQLWGGKYGPDYCAALDRSLHRIGIMPGIDGSIAGFTLRVERYFDDAAALFTDLLDQRVIPAFDPETGQGRESLAFLGPNKVGKTTDLRGAAEYLASKGLIVLVVDHQGELGGSANVPHPALGQAIRLHVPKDASYTDMMLQAVLRHSADVVIVDEVAGHDEVKALLSITRRAVSVIATVHGRTLADVVENDDLRGLLGDINDNILLGDQAAANRATSSADFLDKLQRQRKRPPMFGTVLELDSHHSLSVVSDVAGSVDAYLQGQPYTVERRLLGPGGKLVKSAQTRDPRGRTVSAESRPRPTLADSQRPVKVFFRKLQGQVVVKALTECSDRAIERVDDIKDADLVIQRGNGIPPNKPPKTEVESVAGTWQAVVEALEKSTPLRANVALMNGGLS